MGHVPSINSTQTIGPHSYEHTRKQMLVLREFISTYTMAQNTTTAHKQSYTRNYKYASSTHDACRLNHACLNRLFLDCRA